MFPTSAFLRGLKRKNSKIPPNNPQRKTETKKDIPTAMKREQAKGRKAEKAERKKERKMRTERKERKE